MEITDDRKIELFDDLIDWIYDHTTNNDDSGFVIALDSCGMIVDEIAMITNLSEEEIEKMLSY